MGEGGYYICQPEYMEQFQKKLGFRPFEGTLNILVDKEDVSKLEILRNTGLLINGFERDGRTFGNVLAYKAKIRNKGCAVIAPERSTTPT